MSHRAIPVVLGAGAWGTALAQHAALAGPAVLWTRDAAHAAALSRDCTNARYLPGVVLHPALRIESSLHAALAQSDGPVVIGTSMAGLRPVLASIAPHVGTRPVLWLCKGVERDGGALPHQVFERALPVGRGGALFGPSFAQEVARGLPVALTVASADAGVRAAATAAFHHGAARIYSTDDVIGVELGGALKNVMAIAAGVSDGLALGMNARAALITRGLAEIARLGKAMGARLDTFMGLTGLGDLVLTCTGDLSRNRRVGLGLAQGVPLERILGELGHVAEGVACARAALELATRHAVQMPILAAVNELLDGRATPPEALAALLAREARAEADAR